MKILKIMCSLWCSMPARTSMSGGGNGFRKSFSIQRKLHLIKYNLKSTVLFILTLGVPEVTPVFEKIHVNCHLPFFNDLTYIKAVTNFSPYTPQHYCFNCLSPSKVATCLLHSGVGLNIGSFDLKSG